MATKGGREKGCIPEEIAAWLHDWPDVQVEKNARLVALGETTGRREIDVLLTTSVAGYPVRIAIECKNETEPIGKPAIDAFYGKLHDVGIPPQHGIFISASRYTKGAIRRAAKDGIRTLLLKGLSPDGLKSSITGAAHQSIVFLLATVDTVTWFTRSPDRLPHLPMFVDAEGRLCGTVPHLIAQKWLEGSIPTKAGPYDVPLPIPDDWRPFVASGEPVELIKREVYARVKVVALAFSMEGKTEEFSLLDAATMQAEKVGVRAFFKESHGRYPLTPYESEDDLAQALASHRGLKITTRIKVPRIQYLSAFWPISRRAAERLFEIARSVKAGGGPTPQIPISEVEGLEIAAAWEQPLTVPELDELLLAARRSATPREDVGLQSD
jgi:hypothetical protein